MFPFSEAVIWWAFGVSAALYLGSAALVLAAQVGEDRRRRALEPAEAALRGHIDEAGRPSSGALRLAVSRLVRVRPHRLWRLAANGTLPPAEQRAVAEALLSRVGSELIVDAANRDARLWRRVAALRALALSRRSESWRCLAKALADDDPDLRLSTVALLGRLPERRAAEMLAQALADGTVARSRAATALDEFPLDIGELVIPLLSHDDREVRYWGTRLIRRYRAIPGVPAQLSALASGSDKLIRRAALETIGACGYAECEPAVRAGLTDAVPFVRAHAARALGAFPSHQAATAVARLLADREWIVRFAARQALEAMGVTARPALTGMLDDTDRFAREGAADVLDSLAQAEAVQLSPGFLLPPVSPDDDPMGGGATA